jgi:hypothetical protein
MSDVNLPSACFRRALSRTILEAVSGGLRLRLVLRGGEVREGISASCSITAGDGDSDSLMWVEPADREPEEFTVEIDGTEVLVEEVAEFSLGPVT